MNWNDQLNTELDSLDGLVQYLKDTHKVGQPLNYNIVEFNIRLAEEALESESSKEVRNACHLLRVTKESYPKYFKQ